ncbi:MAG: HDIG domain-containing protein [Defluviitaleaceae bacterium]|nr:HDIG domain-containing protein [Defluviitaleaceae bacterium]
MRKNMINTIFIFAAFFITCIAIASGSYFNAGFTMEVDEPSEMRVRAPRDIEDLAGTERNRQAARVLAEGLVEIFSVDVDIWGTVANNLGSLHGQLEGIREAYILEHEAFEEAFILWEEDVLTHVEISDNLTTAWQLQVIEAHADGLPTPEPPTIPPPPEQPEWEGSAFLAFAHLPHLPHRFDEVQQEFIIGMADENFEQLWYAVESTAYAVQISEIIHEVDFMTERAVREALGGHSLERTSEELAEIIVLSFLLPNAVPNVELNQQRFNETASAFAIAWIYEGDIIVDEGEIVTQEIYDTLDRLNMLAPESLLDNLESMLGVFFLVAVLFMACIMYLYFYREGISTNLREIMLLLTLYLLTISLVWTLSEASFPFLPILIFPMLVSILIDRRCAIALTFALILICYFIVDGDLTYLLFYSASGMLFCIFSKYTTDRGKSIWVGLLLSSIMFALAISTMFITGQNLIYDDLTSLFITAGFAAASGILTVFLCMGSLPLWETFFGVVTPIKLLDLTNPTNLLLRRLTIEAPGTYHHSLIVANLAETAAFDIDANAHAARVGGYYHDVGKLKYPHYFAENLDGENPHDILEPKNSSKIIMSHVSYGLTLATEHRLPQFVRDMIREHHGTTLMQYFFSKAREAGEPCEEADFRYPYTIPQTRESACVMLADSVEAAVRSMIPKIKSVEEVEKTIRFIVRGKLNDGQLADSQLSIKDVNVIEQSFFRVLKGMYHERIAYPEKKA